MFKSLVHWIAFLCAILMSSVGAQTLVQTIPLVERFGVNHPLQVVEFALSQQLVPGTVSVLNDANAEVPSQVLQGGRRIAIQTSLAANQTINFRVMANRAPRFVMANRVDLKAITINGLTLFEMANGRAGARVLRTDSGPPDLRLAPIQGVRLHNGIWEANGPNYIWNYRPGSSLPNSAMLSAQRITTTVLERGPLKTVLQVHYDWERPVMRWFDTILRPAGPGFYTSRLTMIAGSPTVQIQESTDTEMQYYLNMHRTIRPTEARYRGHNASTVANGRNEQGTVYTPNRESFPADALFTLNYALGTTQNPNFRELARWNPWASNHGWYWMLRNSNPALTSPAAGIFAGSASTLSNATNVHAGVYWVGNDGTGQPASGFSFRCTPRVQQTSIPANRVQMSWTLWVGAESDILPATQFQPIGMAMNATSGINLTKMTEYAQSGISSTFAGQLLNQQAVATMISRVRTNPSYYTELSNADPSMRPLLDAWRDSSGVASRNLLRTLRATATDALNRYVWRDGIYDFYYHYWMGASRFAAALQLLTGLTADPSLTPAEKQQVYDIISFYGGIVSDNDFAPMQSNPGVSYGTANMPTQMVAFRGQFQLLLPGIAGLTRAQVSNLEGTRSTVFNAPTTMEAMSMETALTFQSLSDQARRAVNNELNDDGASKGSSHYVGASMSPLLSQLLALKSTGQADIFRENSRLQNFGRFLIGLLSPAESRFGNQRKTIAIGDSPIAGQDLTGLLGTGLADVNPQLSRELMGAWNQTGRTHTNYGGSSILRINDSLQSASPTQGDASFSGYYSVLRNGVNTAQESVAWLLTGDYYSDHRHQDRGNFMAYMLGSPLSMDWSSMYSPSASSAAYHSVVVPDNSYGAGGWFADNQSVNGIQTPWRNAREDSFLSFSDSGSTTTASDTSDNSMTWRRTVRSLHYNDARPVFVIDDQFSGMRAGEAKVFNLNLAAAGPVRFPNATIDPIQRRHLTNGSRRELVSTSAIQTLAPGLARIGFTGSFGIDFDLLTVSTSPLEATIGNWGHNWSTSREAAEFQRSTGRAYEEAQHVLRLRSSGSFRTIIVGRRKGEAAPTSTFVNGSVVLTWADGATLTIGANHAVWTQTGGYSVTSFGTAAVTAQGVTLSGGPSEFTVRSGVVSISVHGAPGARVFSVPAGLRAPAGVVASGNSWTVNSTGTPLRLQ
jgi:hypothetical protein